MKLLRWLAVLSFLVPLFLIQPRPIPAQSAAPTELFFSEYIEGSSNNKALEIYNGTGAPIDLGAGSYSVQVFFNGSPTAGLTVNLAGTVAAGDVFVLAHASANAAILAQADQTNNLSWYNGDDALVLRKNTVVVDAIGQIGFDPGTEWGTDLTSTMDNTLRRLPAVCQGDSNGADTFVPATGWEGFATDTSTGLGAHTTTCTAPPTFLINEVDADQGDTDAAEFIELYDWGAGNTSLNGVVVVLYGGETDTAYAAYDLDGYTTGTSGYFLICGTSAVLPGCNLLAGAEFLQDGPAAVAVYTGDASSFPAGTSLSTANLLDALVYDTDDADDPGLLALLNAGQPQVNENQKGKKDTQSSQRCPNGSGGSRNTSSFTQYSPTSGALNTCVTTIGNCGEPSQLIHAVQGNGASSLLTGSQVEIEGVVVGDFQEAAGLRGFFVQEEDAQADADPATSEGIFVYESSPSMEVTYGQTVRVLGTVTEYYGLTELSTVSGVRTCPSAGSATQANVTLPVAALTDWERWEGMLIHLPQTLYVTDNYNLGRYGELELSVNSRLYAPTQIALPGSAAIAQNDLNDRSRIQLDDGSNLQNPLPLPPYLDIFNTRRLDDKVTDLTGVLSYGFSSYEVHPVQPVSFAPGRGRPVLLPIASSKLTIISTNLLNYFTTLDTGAAICGPSGTLDCRGANTTDELNRQRAKIISAFRMMNPDIAGVIELENNPTAAIQDLVDSLNNAVGAGTYAYLNTGVIGTDAIRVGLIYKPARVSPVGAFKVLDSTVDSNFLDTKNRPSLAQTFQTPAGARFTVVVNHFKSKGSSCADVGDPDTGDEQGNCNLTRTKAATALVNWLATDPTSSGDPDFLIIGDLNSYAREDPITALKTAGYTNLVERSSTSPLHSYTFEGESGTLDYAFASPSFAFQLEWASEFHVNADEPSALDYNNYNQPLLYASNLYRYADHDPLIITDSPWNVNRVGDELQISYGLANEFPQYAVLHLNDSYFRMNYGPPSGWGTSIVLLPAFWSGGVYYQGAPITAYQFWVNGDNLELTLQGTLQTLVVDLTVTLEPPKTNALAAHVQARLFGDVPLDNRPGEAFKPVFLSSMHFSGTQWDTPAAFAGCDTYAIPTSGWLISPTQNVQAKEFGFFGGSSAWKTNAPAVRIEFGDPVQLAGWVTASSDPNDDNLGLWAASSTVLNSWSYTVTATNATQKRCVFLPALSR
jgi:predicted extracellular nuclease